MSKGPFSFSRPGASASSPSREPKRLDLIRLSRISVEPVTWLWPDRIPLGALTLIAGEPDAGKTAITIDVIARSTTGGQWPNGEGQVKQGSWLYVTTENDTQRTIKPRLIAASGNVSQLTVVKGTIDKGQSIAKRGFDLSQDLAELEKQIEDGFSTDHMDCVGLVLDPLNEYLGEKVNSWRDSDVRRVLGPLVALGEKHQIAVIGIMHPAKGEATTMLNKILGSVAFSATARCIHYAARDDEASEDAPEQFVFSMVKNNLGRKPVSLAYELPTTFIEPQKGDDPEKAAKVGKMVFVRWLGATDRKAADIVFKDKEPPAGSRTRDRQDAILWLRNRLGADKVPVKTVKQDAAADGVKPSALKYASDMLGVRSEPASLGGAWVMFMPPPKPGQRTPF